MNAPSPPLAPMATRARPYRVSLHWDAREQSLESYAATALDVLAFLTASSDAFDRGFIRGDGLNPFEKDRTCQLETNVRTWEFNGVEYSGHQAKLPNGRRGSRQLELDLIVVQTDTLEDVSTKSSASQKCCGRRGRQDKEVPSDEAVVRFLIDEGAAAP